MLLRYMNEFCGSALDFNLFATASCLLFVQFAHTHTEGESEGANIRVFVCMMFES